VDLPIPVNILQVMSDAKSILILSTIAKNQSIKSRSLKDVIKSTKKQFYSITRQMLKLGLIQRSQGYFSLTTFGRLIYYVQLEIENAIKYYWKFKAIDSIQSSGQIGNEELVKLIKTMVDDENLQNILMEIHYNNRQLRSTNSGENSNVLIVSKMAL
jgi:hypothetical protein